MTISPAAHAAALWAGLNLILMLVLSVRVVRIRRAQQIAAGDDMVLEVQIGVAEGETAELPDRRGPAGGHHVVVRGVLLQHQPHGADIILGVPPVAAGIEITEFKRLGQAQFYPRSPVGIQFHKADPVAPDDYCLNFRPENGRGFQNNEIYHLCGGLAGEHSC